MTQTLSSTPLSITCLLRRALTVSSICAISILSGCADKAEAPASEQPIETTSVEHNQNSDSMPSSSQNADTQLQDTQLADAVALDDTPAATTRDTPLNIDWQKIDSGIKPVNPATFNYPFKLNSPVVTSQAEFSNISPEQAQHSLTVGMASNEPLEKIIDQLGDSYLSHTYSEDDAKLIINTTPNVTPSTHDYVIAHEFARGLVLPIEIIHQGQN